LRLFLSGDVLESDVKPSFFERMNYALDNSKYFILLMIPNTMHSEWVKMEHSIFFNQYYMSDKRLRKFLIYGGNRFEEAETPVPLKLLPFANNIHEALRHLFQD
jgi:hypothetical protein